MTITQGRFIQNKTEKSGQRSCQAVHISSVKSQHKLSLIATYLHFNCYSSSTCYASLIQPLSNSCTFPPDAYLHFVKLNMLTCLIKHRKSTFYTSTLYQVERHEEGEEEYLGH